jgi:uncharacterized membrane protein YkvA (DUF1232 family)
MLLRIAIAVAAALILAWLLLVAYLLIHRPAKGTAREAARLLPDTVRLLRRLAADRELPHGVRARLWLLLAYLVFPIDLVPDFVPVVGYVDDVVIVGATLRSVVRRAGPGPVRRHWPGTEAGLQALWHVGGLPGEAPRGAHPPAQ